MENQFRFHQVDTMLIFVGYPRQVSIASILAAVMAIAAFAACNVFAQQSAPAPKPVASIQGVPITEEELNKAAAGELENLEMRRAQLEAQLAQARQQILENSLKRLIEDRLLAAEAAKRGIKKEELIAREITGKLHEPTPQEIDSYYEANKARIPNPKEQVSAQIAQVLRQQNQAKLTDEVVESLKKQYSVVSNLEPLRFQVESKGHPAKGPESAPVTLVEFSDFQCSYCQTFAATLKRLVGDFGDMVRLVYRQYPNPSIHPDSLKAAEASLCAQEQGRFWEMHDLLFKDTNKLKVPDLKAYAGQLGLDSKAFDACIDTGRYAQRVKQDLFDATRIGVTGTPTLLINGRPFIGALPYEEISTIIDEELKRKFPAADKKP